jgi:energy-coupling factor transport system permease protein
LLSIVFMTLVSLADSYPSFLILWLFSLLVATLAGKPFRLSPKGLRPILFIALFTMVASALTCKGTNVTGYGIGLHITPEVINSTVKVVLRLILLVTGASLLTSTTTPVSLTGGLESLIRPLGKLKVPIHDTAMMMSMALRFIPVLHDETEKIIRAQMSRGAVFGVGGPARRAKGFMPVLVPLFAGTLRRADDLATAMEARCYMGGAGRTRMKRLAFSGDDFAAACAMAVLTTVVLFVEQPGFLGM